ncbi:hypothetical protein BD779DRAFT_1440390 [Infundibulicybe gibba]|nr:hypothetical protein BD779DRAFT_1440390 [Infundibulicybe gibba]
MKNFTFTQLVLFALVWMFSSANALPTIQQPRDVFKPEVFSPHAGTVWFVGQHYNVTWDTSKAPVNITNKIGKILLRKAGPMTPLILADGFSILLGKTEVLVPLVLDSDDYQVNLFGDSGDFSDFFTIQG